MKKLLLGSFATALFIASIPSNAATITIEITSMIDGESQIILKDNSIQWHHLSWIVPGVSADNALDITPTTLRLSIDGQLQQSIDWYPSWPTPNWDNDAIGSPSNWNRGEQFSDEFSELTLPISLATSDFTLTPILSRGFTSIAELPNSGNGSALVIDFDDSSQGSSDVYSSSVSFTAPVPEPSVSVMLLGGVSLAGVIRRRRPGQR